MLSYFFTYSVLSMLFCAGCHYFMVFHSFSSISIDAACPSSWVIQYPWFSLIFLDFYWFVFFCWLTLFFWRAGLRSDVDNEHKLELKKLGSRNHEGLRGSTKMKNMSPSHKILVFIFLVLIGSECTKAQWSKGGMRVTAVHVWPNMTIPIPNPRGRGGHTLKQIFGPPHHLGHFWSSFIEGWSV